MAHTVTFYTGIFHVLHPSEPHTQQQGWQKLLQPTQFVFVWTHLGEKVNSVLKLLGEIKLLALLYIS